MWHVVEYTLRELDVFVYWLSEWQTRAGATKVCIAGSPAATREQFATDRPHFHVVHEFLNSDYPFLSLSSDCFVRTTLPHHRFALIQRRCSPLGALLGLTWASSMAIRTSTTQQKILMALFT
jgi:hypothetical protein